MSDPLESSAPAAERPFQYTLGHAALWVTAICFVLAAVSQWGFWGVIGCVVVAAMGILCYGTYWGEWKLASSAACILLVFAGAGVFDQSATRHGPHRIMCRHKLKQIGVALHSYHEAYGCLPPPYIADANGNPMHSWRVLLLPFMEQQDLYSLYNFDEPWNGPNNRKLAAEIPEVYRCADESRGSSADTAFLAIGGPATMWPAAGGVRLDQITDGSHDTLAVVEIEKSGVNWLEPRDFDVASAPRAMSSQSAHELSKALPNRRRKGVVGTWALFADGSVVLLRKDVSVKDLQALLTIAGGDDARIPR